jgi:hypothetical protein
MNECAFTDILAHPLDLNKDKNSLKNQNFLTVDIILRIHRKSNKKQRNKIHLQTLLLLFFIIR